MDDEKSTPETKEKSEKTISDVFETFTDEQKEVVYAIAGKIAEMAGETNNETKESKGGNNMKESKETASVKTDTNKTNTNKTNINTTDINKTASDEIDVDKNDTDNTETDKTDISQSNIEQDNLDSKISSDRSSGKKDSKNKTDEKNHRYELIWSYVKI